MRLYRIGAAWRGTQADARTEAKSSGLKWIEVEVPTDKAGLLAFLNTGEHAPPRTLPLHRAPPPRQPPEELTRGVAKSLAGTDCPDATARATEAIEIFLRETERVEIVDLQRHLADEHRIGVSEAWIVARLCRLGWRRQLYRTSYIPDREPAALAEARS